ncbi:MAG: hypothetical protein Tsb002_37280 [Wenzhouxiangellaceae bacterium]
MTIDRQRLLVLLAQVQQRPNDDHRLAQLAATVSLSPAYLQRIFVRTIGESPQRIIRRLTLERAALQLLQTRDSVLSIALDNGFDSHEGFCRAFRKHFGLAPSSYRQRGLRSAATADGSLLNMHERHVRTIGPCVGLYRISLNKAMPTTASKGLSAMTYQIEVQHCEETPVLFMRRRITREQIASTLAELLPAVYQYAISQGIALAGQPFTRYGSWSAGGVTIEAGLPVAAAATGEGEIHGGVLSAGEVAATIHVGPYETLNQAYSALEAWFADQQRQPGGDPWEVYITDPGEEPDPAKWQTAVYWPLAAAD